MASYLYRKRARSVANNVRDRGYTRPLPTNHLTLNRKTLFFPCSFVDYVSFCAAVEPKHGGRDLDNQERELEKAWKQKSNEGGVEEVDLRTRGQTAGRMPKCSASGRSEKDRFCNDESFTVRGRNLHAIIRMKFTAPDAHARA